MLLAPTLPAFPRSSSALARTLRTGMAFAAAGAIEIFAPGAFAATLEQRTTSSTDDAEEFATGQMYLTSGDLELTHDTSDQTVGMRWNGVAIPAGATITAAWIQFAAKESRSEVTNLSFRGQAADAAATFQSTARDVSSRARTLATTTWSPDAWNLKRSNLCATFIRRVTRLM